MITDPEPASRIFIDPLSDSTRWNAFAPREGDIVVTTPVKSGTTWTQAILALLISGDPEVDAETAMKSPWIDLKLRDVEEVMARLAAQAHRRQVKTHTPFDAIPYWRELRYLSVYRHPIDAHFSWCKHRANMKKDFGFGEISDDPSECFRDFLAEEANCGGLGLILDHYRATLAREPRENLMRLHYADMLRDLPGAAAGIAAHVGIAHPPELMEKIAQAATFDSMRAHADRFTPSAGREFWHDDRAFFDSASSNKWVGVLTGDDLAAYDARMNAALTPKERAWLEWGSAGRPS